ncbi:PREDICTED: rap guanine nucleotide exchange factor-like 1 isoform X1 [Myotis davidii]|uniref:rap guanine nucleotide exchange factor-like 1 isoform X1 n=1 Tax=Myotis davidii TaxID=225400 RepID=UPI000767AC07|nr:PREDICTED: rap guanine nucleotide exchange factor-like 1 isoform X1 [Myotis davidii]
MMGQVARSPVWLRRTRPWRQESGVGSVRLDPGSAPLTSVVPNDLYTDILLDDIVLTHSLFLPTEKFLQELHQYFVLAGGREGPEGLGQKQACLAMLLHFLDTYQGLLQEEEGAGRIIKDLYLLIMKDESLYQDLREDTLRLHQLVETVELKIPEESQPPNKQVKPLFRHFRRIDSCLQTRVAFRGSDEIFCRVYMPDHSYVTIRSRLSASVQDILGSVTEKLQYSEEPAGREDSLILVAVASSGARFSAEKVLLQPTEDCVFTTLGINSHLFACTRDSYEALVPLPEEIQVSPGDTEIHRVEPEDVANHLTAFHWELFRCVHELEFVDYVFHGERGRRETANLELLLQRCSEVTHWVATEVLLCEAQGKRVQLLKKFIKIAAICKQNQDLLSFYAVVMGLDNAAVSRLRLTWEKLPGKFKNLFRKFENLTDPCRNHKSYREVISKMKPPVIPFVPLILKDLTFLHEGSKTLVDGLVNIEKLHSVAEKVRTVRKYRSRPLCLDMEASPHHLQTKAYVRQFQVIDNQNLLFELSYKLEANSQ